MRSKAMFSAVMAAMSLLLAGCVASPRMEPVMSTITAEPLNAATGPHIEFAPSRDAQDLQPSQQLSATARQGSLVAVNATTSTGEKVPGAIEGKKWATTQPLAVNEQYKVTAQMRREDGSLMSQTSVFSTIHVKTQASVTVMPGDNKTMGVGMPIMVEFSEAVTNKDKVAAAMLVNTTPKVAGAWRWMSSTQAHWRPKEFWPAGTKVQVKIPTASMELADGVWGKKDVTSSFIIGRQQISYVDMQNHTLVVKRDGKTIRTIPVTTGKPGFATRIGTKLIMSKDTLVRMDAASTGISKDDPEYYNLEVHYALRITNSGEYLHAAPWSSYAHGRSNASHGCTGMSMANARWVYDNFMIGDPVIFTGSKKELEPGNGWTDWNIPWSKWTSRSA